MFGASTFKLDLFVFQRISTIFECLIAIALSISCCVEMCMEGQDEVS